MKSRRVSFIVALMLAGILLISSISIASALTSIKLSSLEISAGEELTITINPDSKGIYKDVYFAKDNSILEKIVLNCPDKCFDKQTISYKIPLSWLGSYSFLAYDYKKGEWLTTDFNVKTAAQSSVSTAGATEAGALPLLYETFDGTTIATTETTTDNGLALYLSFDEGTGTTAKDLSGFGRDGVLASEGWADGKYEKAVDFNIAHKVDAGSFSFLAENQPFSIAAWIYPTSYVSEGMWHIFTRHYNYGDQLGDWRLELDSTGKITWQVRNNDNSDSQFMRSNSNIPLNTWTHVAGVFDGSRMLIYINGVLDATQSGVNHGSDSSNTNKIVVGDADYEPYGRYFRGLIDEAKIYNKALSAEEITQLYSSQQITPPQPSITYVDGKVNQAVLVDEGDILKYPASSYFSKTKGTIEFWIKPNWNGIDTQLGRQYRIFDEGVNSLHSPNHLSIGKYYGGGCNCNYLFFVIDDASWSESTAWTEPSQHELNTADNPSFLNNWRAGEWHHIAATWDNTAGMQLYVDGALIRSNTDKWATDAIGDYFYLGSALGTDQFADAAFDEFKVYDYARTAGQVAVDAGIVELVPTTISGLTEYISTITATAPIKESLISKLSAAEKSLQGKNKEAGKTAAIKQLNALMNEISAQSGKKKISTADASVLLQGIDSLMTSITNNLFPFFVMDVLGMKSSSTADNTGSIIAYTSPSLTFYLPDKLGELDFRNNFKDGGKATYTSSTLIIGLPSDVWLYSDQIIKIDTDTGSIDVYLPILRANSIPLYLYVAYDGSTYYADTKHDGTGNFMEPLDALVPEHLARKAGMCSDGTYYDRCSATMPEYCDNGNLIDKCDVCGCQKSQKCQSDGACIESGKNCVDSDGGEDYYTFGKTYYLGSISEDYCLINDPSQRVESCSYSNFCQLMEQSCQGDSPVGKSTVCSTGCANGACNPPCTNECPKNGDKQCSGNGYQKCGNYDGIDGCLEWSPVYSCQAGYSCSKGECVTSACANECSNSGEVQCSGNGYQTCGNYDSDSCIEWSSTISCGSNEICSDGNCLAPICTVGDANLDGTITKSELSEKSDYTDVIKALFGLLEFPYETFCCFDTNKDGEITPGDALNVYKYASGMTDYGYTGEYCYEPTETIACTDDCTTSGARGCIDTPGYESKYKVCSNYDADPCLEWGSMKDCGSGEVCSDGNCLAPICTIGDANLDGTITESDAMTIFKASLDMIQVPSETFCCFDTNKDGEITPGDALNVYNYFLGLTGTGYVGEKCFE